MSSVRASHSILDPADKEERSRGTSVGVDARRRGEQMKADRLTMSQREMKTESVWETKRKLRTEVRGGDVKKKKKHGAERLLIRSDVPWCSTPSVWSARSRQLRFHIVPRGVMSASLGLCITASTQDSYANTLCVFLWLPLKATADFLNPVSGRTGLRRRRKPQRGFMPTQLLDKPFENTLRCQESFENPEM